MWTTYKTKPGDTLKSVVKSYRLKDECVVSDYDGNKKFRELLKKGRELPKGTVLWVPDPKATAYVVRGRSGDVCLDEKAYNEYLKSVNRRMDTVHRQFEAAFSRATSRHDFMREVNDEHGFVSRIVGSRSGASEPTSKRMAAEKEFKQFTTAVARRNYKDYEQSFWTTRKAVNNYIEAVNAWCEGRLGRAVTALHALEVAKTAGEICGTVVAVTVAAPATLSAKLLLSAAVSGASGLAYDGAEQIGRVAVGDEPMSIAELRKRFLFNAAAGLVNAAISEALMKLVGVPLVKAILRNKTASRWISGLAKKALPNRIFQAEINAVADELKRKGASVSFEEYVEHLTHARIEIETLTKFFTDLGVESFSKYIQKSKVVSEHVEAWVKDNPQSIGGNDEYAVAEAAAQYLSGTNVVSEIYEGVLKEREAEFRGVLRKALLKEAERMSK